MNHHLQRQLPRISWALAIYVAFVFIQSLFFKFSGSDETKIIFDTLGRWMAQVGFGPAFGAAFASYGGTLVGAAELLASGLILYPATRVWGALLGFGVMSGAICFHLFTPLGIHRFTDISCQVRDAVPPCPTDAVLFIMACGVWLCCLALLWMGRDKLRALAKQSPG